MSYFVTPRIDTDRQMTSNPLAIAAAGGAVLTANKRLARYLSGQYDQQQIAAGSTVWPSPAIFSFDGWILRLASQLSGERALLTETQSQRLWEEIIGADAAARGRNLLQVPQAARRALEAHRLLAAYLTEVPTAECDEDHLAFLRWREVWQRRLRDNGWLDRADMLTTVADAIAAGEFVLPDHVVFAGFDDQPPAVHRLREILIARGCTVDDWEPPGFAKAVKGRCVAMDMADEVRLCARWARAWLERSPQARVGVIAPRLNDYQGLIERLFRAELDPSSCLGGVLDAETFTLSLGTPLAGEGVIRAALRLLAAGDPLTVDEVGWLLRSPYLGGAQTEAADRARADRALRRRGRRDWRLAPLVRALAGVPRMAAIIEKLLAACQQRQKRLPGEWAEHFAGLLAGCGWPGERALHSREFQALDHFRATLGQLASLDRVATLMSRGEALATLNRLATETIFQQEGGESRIQVLGMLEAAGLTFDALWILGLHDAVFPSPPRPNPFLPLSVQSRLRMPHADALREREFAQRLAGRLLTAAAEIVVSWPAQLDGAPARPSPLIRFLPDLHPALAPSCDPFQQLLATPCLLEQIIDDQAMPLATNRPFSGGSRILTDQALCPFRAFAHHRLHAEQLDTPDVGLDNMTRGTLVHAVLERFWIQVDSQAALFAMTPERQAELLAAATEEALCHYERRARYDLPPRLRELESRRLSATVAGWLELERARAPFRVMAIEQWHDAVVGKLTLRTRIDRIDALEDGRLAVFDYKTGQPSPKQWLDSRVTEPQLPLYCLDLGTEQIGAVLFAVVRGRKTECLFRGLAREPEAWPGLTTTGQDKLLGERGWRSFDEVVAHWRQALPALGDAFVAGRAAVDPVDSKQACAYCDLATLCRIAEQERDEDAAEGDGEDE